LIDTYTKNFLDNCFKNLQKLNKRTTIEKNRKGEIVAYVRKGKKLPSLDLIRAYQSAIKEFCENRTQSQRNNQSTFRGENSLTFFNEKIRQVAIFNRETKVFITAYKLAELSVDKYLTTGNIGSN
jgi:hypothetical protein